MVRAPCLHCRRSPPFRKGCRGLCGMCYAKPTVRRRYPKLAKPVNGGLGGRAYRPPERATDAPPGSEAKIQELARRAEERVGLFHEADPALEAFDQNLRALCVAVVQGSVKGVAATQAG